MATTYDPRMDQVLPAPTRNAWRRAALFLLHFGTCIVIASVITLLLFRLDSFLVSQPKTYETRYRAHVSVLAGEEQAGVAHHIYLLTAAEMGYAGLFAFALFMASLTGRAAWHGLRARSTETTLVGGFLVGLVALHFVGALEWVFRLSPVLYLFGVVAASVISFADPTRMRLLELEESIP